jgi:hypothetical protein
MLANCLPCQRRKRAQTLKTAYLHPIPQASKPWQVVGTDVGGPVGPATESGATCFILWVDYHTHYQEAAALVNQKADTICANWLTQVVARYGAGTVLVSDNSQAYSSELLKEIAGLLKTEKVFSVAHHAMTNGLTEKRVGLTADALAILSTEKNVSWEIALPFVNYAINTSYCRTLKTSPHRLLFHYEPKNFFDQLVAPEGESQMLAELDQFRHIFTANSVRHVEAARRAVAKAYAASQAKDKEYYDSQVNECLISRGALIFWHRPQVQRLRATYPKLSYPFTGPWRVVQVNLPNLVIQDPFNTAGPKRKIHMTQVKVFAGDSLFSPTAGRVISLDELPDLPEEEEQGPAASNLTRTRFPAAPSASRAQTRSAQRARAQPGQANAQAKPNGSEEPEIVEATDSVIRKTPSSAPRSGQTHPNRPNPTHSYGLRSKRQVRWADGKDQ